MAERKKLDPELNTPVTMKMLFDSPIVGEKSFGNYYLYAIGINGDEFSFFAPSEVHDKLKDFKKGDAVSITKLVEKKGTKLVTTFSIEKPTNRKSNGNSYGQSKDNYFEILDQSFEDAYKFNEKFKTIDLNRVGITLFIARSKIYTNGLVT